MEYLSLIEKGIWFGLAAIGFAILFNVPTRTILVIWFMGALGGITKLICMHIGFGVVMSSFAGAGLIGFLSIWAAHSKHSPPMIFAIPSVIPMVPGAFAYRMMLGLIKLAGDQIGEDYDTIVAETINNGLKAIFILMSLAFGVALPMLLTRKESAKDIRLKKIMG
ncbi:MAG: threonine/serine exporter [Cyclobacteriaceae bacterium]|nr:threonine/serine exporter [Cyclobacteriaceae bacterium]